MSRIANQELNALIKHYDKNSNLLNLLVGGYLTHMSYGKGEVVFVDSTKYGVFLDVNFENSATYTFSIDAFKRGDFTNIILSEEAFTEITAYIKPFVEEKARKEKEKEEERVRREQEEKARKEQEEKARKEQEEKARLEELIAKQYLIRHGIKSLWYIAHVENLDSIVEKGLYCRNLVEAKGLTANDISDKHVQLRRRSYHNYVNLYFADNTPMLYVVIKKFQASIVLLELDPFETMLAGVRITDGNAASYDTVVYDNLSGLDELDWSIIRERRGVYESEEKRKRSAEFLIMRHVDPSCIRSVHVQSPQVAEFTKNTLSRLNRRNIAIKKDLTINGIA